MIIVSSNTGSGSSFRSSGAAPKGIRLRKVMTIMIFQILFTSNIVFANNIQNRILYSTPTIEPVEMTSTGEASDRLIIYSDAENLIGSSWSQNGTLKEINTGAYEGILHYHFEYNIVNYWAGFGFNLESTIDASSFENLIIALNGPSVAGHYIYIIITDASGNESEAVSIQNSGYGYVQIPVSELIGTTDFDPSRISYFLLGIGGASSGQGEFFFDEFYFGGALPVIPVTAVNIIPETLDINGEMMKLTAEVIPSNASDKSLIWSSDNPAIASVNSFGTVMPNSTGTTKVKVFTNDGNFSDSAEVTVIKAIGDRVMKVMPLGNSITLGAGAGGSTLIPGGYRLPLWENLVGSGLSCGVDFAGNLEDNPATGLDDPDHEGHSGWSTGEILNYIDIFLASTEPDIVMMHLGTNDLARKLEAEAPANLRSLIDHICAALPYDGKLYVSKIIPIGPKGGQSTLDYNQLIEDAIWEKQSEGLPVYLVDAYNIWSDVYISTDWTHPNQEGYKVLGDFWFNVIKDDIQVECETIGVTGVDISPADVEMIPEETMEFEADVIPENASNKDVDWKSSNTEVAEVDANGTVSAVGEGNAYIIVTTVDGNFSDSARIKVNTPQIAVTGVAVSPEKDSLIINETLQLTASVQPENATNRMVSWSSSNQDVAGVDENGMVTALMEGTSAITVNTDEGSYTAVSIIVVTENNTSTGNITEIQPLIYPNPYQPEYQIITISGLKNGDTSFILYDFMGKKLIDKTLRAGEQEISIPAESLVSGLYLVKIRSGNKTFIDKLIVN